MSYIPNSSVVKWTSGSNYALGDYVSYGRDYYICVTANTAGVGGNTFSADLALGYWKLTSVSLVGKNYVLIGSDFENNEVSGWTAAKVPATTGTTNGFPNTTLTAGLAFANSYYVFTITSGSATIGATYTNNSQTFTVAATISSQTQLVCTGTGAPQASGTLTKATGTGDATITFSAYKTTDVAHLSAPAIESSAPISGKYSLKMASDATGPTAGDMYISQPYAIDICDQAKALQIKFSYQLSGDTNAKTNFSGTYSANTYAVAIYDVVNGAWIQPAGCFNFIQKTGVGICSATFQTTSNMTKFQVAVYVANTISSATTATLLLDDFYIGPQPFSQGASMTDWQSYTPTFTNFGTVTNISLKYRKVGDSLEVMGNFTTGSPATGIASISLPPGLSIDTNKLAGASTNSFIGIGSFANASANTSKDVIVISAPGTATTNVYFTLFDYAASNNALTPQNGSAVFNATTNTSITFSVPITGWSSNTVQSADSDTRVLATVLSHSTQSISNNTDTQLTGFTVITDTNSAYSSNQVTIGVTGIYALYAIGFFPANANGTRRLYYKIDSGSWIRFDEKFGTSSIDTYLNGSILISLNTGQTVQFGVFQNSGGAVNFTGQRFSVNRLSGPAVVQASETVACRYSGNATGSISSSFAASAVLSYPTKDYDTHGFMSSGTVTFPTSGKWEVCIAAQINFTAGAAVNSVMTYALGKNGTETVDFQGQCYSTGQATMYIRGSTTLQALAGDTLTAKLINQSGAFTSPSIAGGTANNFICIRLVGNY